MLNLKNIPVRNYEELMEEQRSKIPVYSGEWTNYNPSDPGITILENLAAFHVLQQRRMYEPSDAVKAGLLALLGYTPKRERCAEALLEPEGAKEDFLIPAGQSFAVKDIIYENEQERKMTASRLTGIFGEDQDGLHDYSFLLHKEMSVPAYIFGRKPKAGARIYFVMNAPLMPGEEGILYLSVDSRYGRTPFLEEGGPVFGKICWECYTAGGFTPMEVQDHTRGFVTDGTLIWRQSCQAAPYENGRISGYVWRAQLQYAWYDIPPSLVHVTGFLFPVIQKKTLVRIHSLQGTECAASDCVIPKESSISVFCREPGESRYRKYTECMGEPERGRFYFRDKRYGGDVIRFDRLLFGSGPEPAKNSVRIVIYSPEMMRRYYLGEIYGYDDQEIILPGKHVVSEPFSVIAERKADDGGRIYDFLKPGRTGDGGFSYILHEEEGKLTVLDAGDYIGAALYLGSFAITMGEEGNVRAGNLFTAPGMDDSITFSNPAAGQGGRFQETAEDVRKRFARDLSAPQTAVLPSDYERIAAMTPGLCIGKVHAWMDHERNEVQVAVMPRLPEKFPGLTELYTRELERWLDRHRVLSVTVRVCAPVYIPVFVSGTVYVKPHYENCRQEIEETVRGELDYRNGSRGFGQRFLFESLSDKLESLECVAYIYELGIRPEDGGSAVMDGNDICPIPNGLLCPGSMEIEILPYPGEP